MKHFIVLIILLLFTQYKTENFLIVKDIGTSKLFSSSIDFVTSPFINKRNNFFLELEIYKYSSEEGTFEYRLSQRYYSEQLEKVKDSYFYRSNNIVVTICPEYTGCFDRKMLKVSDSLKQFQSMLFTYDNFVNYTANWAFYQVRYQCDTLLGTVNFQHPIPFQWMNIPK